MPEPLSKLESIIALTVVIEMIKIASLDWALPIVRPVVINSNNKLFTC